MSIQMVDLKGQYLKISNEINEAIQEVIDSTTFINGAWTGLDSFGSYTSLNEGHQKYPHTFKPNGARRRSGFRV